jgi:UDP-N-acetylmuramoylalanine--D-glutamate ligase
VSGLAGRRILVVGLAASGLAAARALLAEGALVRVSEVRADPEGEAELRAAGAEVLTGGHVAAHLDDVHLVVASPGVPERGPVLTWALQRGLPVWSELELGWRSVRVPSVGVTGTNGKSTTTELIASMLRASGLEAIACGNIGYPLSTAAREGHAALAIEASSFQLRFAPSFGPRVTVLLNVAPDHLDWHGSFEAYVDAKARIFANQGADDIHVANRDDATSAAISKASSARLVWFGLGEPGDGEVGYIGEELVGRLDGEIRLGRPPRTDVSFREDAAAAAAAALGFGLDAAAVTEGMRAMRPLGHRGEVVARAGRVRFVDDSKATNVHATLAAMRGRERVVLIAGGRAKGADLSPLRSVASRLAGVVAIGEAAEEIASIFEGVVSVRRAGSMEEAARSAFELAPPDGVVLLAPACASWDLFRDFAERGERFSAAAIEIARQVGTDG